MFDNLLQGNLSNMLQQTGLTPQQAAQALPAAQESVTNTLQTEATSGNFANIAGLFAGQADNPLTSILSNNMVQSLMSKVGLSSSVATTAATAFLPQIITTLSSKSWTSRAISRKPALWASWAVVAWVISSIL